MTKKSRQLALLVVLLVVFFFVVTRQLGTEAEAVATLARRATGEGKTSAAGEQLPRVVDLDLAALELKPGQFSPGRDPFRFQARPAPPPPPKPPPAPKPQPAPVAPRPAPAPPQRRPPPIDFVYLGSFGPKEGRIAVFWDQSDIYNAGVGQVLKEKFVVRGIGFESADIGFVEFPEEPTRRLAAGG